MEYFGATKSDIWKAYKEIKAELEKIKNPESTIIKAQEEAVKAAVFVADSINVESLTEVLSTITEGITKFAKEYDDLVLAIKSKKEELKEIHEIEVSANDLAALAATKAKLIEDSEEKAKSITDEANEYFERKSKEAEDLEELKLTERNREEENYQYETKRKRKIAQDIVDDELSTKKKSLDNREKEITEKEEALVKKEQEHAELVNKYNELEIKINEKIAEAVEEATAKAQKSAQVVANITKASTEADKKIAIAEIESLKAKVSDLEKRLEIANETVAKASVQVSEMAQSALKTQGDAATIAKVSEIAAGSGKK